MTVKMPKDWKQRFTVWEAERARAIIQELKDDEYSVKDYAGMAANLAAGVNGMEVLQCSAVIALNCRSFDRFGEDTQNLDVWIEFKAFDAFQGFYWGGMYLSDIWDIPCDMNEREQHKKLMWLQEYKKES